MLESSFSFLLWMEAGFFPFCFTSIWKLDGFIYTAKIKRSKPIRAFPPHAFHTPSWQLNPLEWNNFPVSELTKAALRSIFQFQAYFMNPANVFSSQPHSLAGWQRLHHFTDLAPCHTFSSEAKQINRNEKPFDFNGDFIAFAFLFKRAFGLQLQQSAHQG